MQSKLEKEHQWLEKLVGEWSCEGEAVMAPGQPPFKWTATESVRSIGGIWVLAESRGKMPDGGDSTMVMTLGYDPQKKRFVGTFVASMMTHLWVYDGALDASGSVMTLDTEGPNCSAEGKLARFKDAIELKSADHRVMTSTMLGEDGKWTSVMTARYQRKA